MSDDRLIQDLAMMIRRLVVRIERLNEPFGPDQVATDAKLLLEKHGLQGSVLRTP